MQLASAAVALALLTACSPALLPPSPATPHPSPMPTKLPATSAPQPSAASGQNWEINLSVSGGFAGVTRSLQVNSTGQLTANDAQSRKQVTAQLPAADLSELADLVSHLQPPHAASLPSGCADCFNYDVTVTVGERLLEFRGDDVTLQGSGWQDLVGRLTALEQDALSGKLK
ncbi:MAG: hypothetical protein M1482_15630 [Chloroflexi bacterium]|nr:hypothetical protein [Chloroflexota bacterium]